MKKEQTFLIAILLWPIIASIISFAIRANFFISIMLFFGIPSMCLSYLYPKNIKRSAIFALVFGVPLTLFIDYIMEVTGGWFVPESIFGSVRLFNYVTIDIIFWFVLYIYFVIMFYEVFMDRHCTCQLYHPNMKYLLMAVFVLLGLFVVMYSYRPALLKINYFYLKFGIMLGLIPIFFAVTKYSKLLGDFFRASAYFFYLSFIYEITALKLGQWSFPAADQFIGFVQIFGVKYPFEEFFFWIMLGAIAVLSYFKLFEEPKQIC